MAFAPSSDVPYARAPVWDSEEDRSSFRDQSSFDVGGDLSMTPDDSRLWTSLTNLEKEDGGNPLNYHVLNPPGALHRFLMCHRELKDGSTLEHRRYLEPLDRVVRTITDELGGDFDPAAGPSLAGRTRRQRAAGLGGTSLISMHPPRVLPSAWYCFARELTAGTSLLSLVGTAAFIVASAFLKDDGAKVPTHVALVTGIVLGVLTLLLATVRWKSDANARLMLPRLPTSYCDMGPDEPGAKTTGIYRDGQVDSVTVRVEGRDEAYRGEDLLRGDLVRLVKGDRVPADVVVMEASADAAVVSEPVSIPKAKQHPSWKHVVLAGAAVAAGEMWGIVVRPLRTSIIAGMLLASATRRRPPYFKDSSYGRKAEILRRRRCWLNRTIMCMPVVGIFVVASYVLFLLDVIVDVYNNHVTVAEVMACVGPVASLALDVAATVSVVRSNTRFLPTLLAVRNDTDREPRQIVGGYGLVGRPAVGGGASGSEGDRPRGLGERTPSRDIPRFTEHGRGAGAHSSVFVSQVDGGGNLSGEGMGSMGVSYETGTTSSKPEFDGVMSGSLHVRAAMMETPSSH